jgi:hypothetical protein
MHPIKLLLIIIALAAPLISQEPTPAPADHERIAKTEVPGQRIELTALSGAMLFAPPTLDKNKRIPLIIHFHGPGWLVEYHVAKILPRAAVITVQLGAGSSIYNRPFDKTDTFRAMLDEARTVLGLKHDWSSINLTAWSAGYGAVRAILRDDGNFARVNGVLLLDGIHASYSPEGKPLADGGIVNSADLDAFLKFARLAVAGKKTFVITHSEIFPATYASTTECTDYLLTTLNLKRRAAVASGPMSMHQLTAVNTGGFHVRGYSGTTAPDHIDHIHAMSEWLKFLKVK